VEITMPLIRKNQALIALLITLAVVGRGLAQEPQAAMRPADAAAYPKLEALNAAYRTQRHDLECRRIADLAALAQQATGALANAAYHQLFGLAITENLCPEAAAAAGRCLALPASPQDVRALAALVQVMARTEKGEHEGALGHLKELFRQAAAGPAGPQSLDPSMALAVGEAFLQRLLRDGRYDIATKLCDLACEGDAPPIVKEHFEDRMARLEMIGKPAPPIAGPDVDGKPLALADLRGKVVLIDFWASWCPPCVTAIPPLMALAEKYHDQGFVILGVSVDAMHEDMKETKAALPAVRRFLVKHRVAWANLLNGQGSSDFAAAYRVEQIPASFLVGRDGKIVAVEQSGEMLERAIVRALAQKDAPGTR
jgi:thiol-disulfide isomerase/thioredoxin